MKWQEFEKTGFLPFIQEHELEQTSWRTRAACWKKKFGIPRSTESLRQHLNRCILQGSYPVDKMAGSRSFPTNVNTQVQARAKPVKRRQNALRCRPQRSPQSERIPLDRHSVWSVFPNQEASPVLSSAPTVEDSLSLPPASPERPTLKNHGKEPNVPPPEEETERLKYCFAFC